MADKGDSTNQFSEDTQRGNYSKEGRARYCFLLMCSFCVGAAYYIAWAVIIMVVVVELYSLITSFSWRFGSISDKWFVVAAFVLVLPLRYLDRYVDRKFEEAKTQLNKR